MQHAPEIATMLPKTGAGLDEAGPGSEQGLGASREVELRPLSWGIDHDNDRYDRCHRHRRAECWNMQRRQTTTYLRELLGPSSFAD